ncbi:fumarylacetoacetate hydrolase family protein [Novosphingobium mangrovi (ex Huang et al. 2023)]|uniref:Fumarylacetoacetate hydrolase family protein n=1 Tax=Novosphingobium mangrovi (ex Huang et al. 2023) TaxID=2976432 RepID=A0ABT2IA03_9SPHN|nr:fumarylacetoacetate hydrolase family protein [Novosphingobium mangrovi (ex Huang et al. 2023)]MCT2401398.1 fumarylacetoacetate hydrolase family protein [Novosphingobium mangrovi (ex Huang et al. 2023)]
MALDPALIERAGDELYDAYRANSTIAPLRDRFEGIDIVDAYRIQERFMDRRLAIGEDVVGKKIGVTSKAVQEMIGVFEPDFGLLTSVMEVEDGRVVDLDRLIQPRAEAEIAFVLKEDLNGPGVTATDVLRATDHVRACFEIVDSRIDGWDIRIQDTVADNASCGVFVLGEDKVDPRDVDLTLAGLLVEMNGEPCADGVGAAVQGSPLNAVAWLANTLGRLGMPFRAGEVILSGSLAPLIPVKHGDSLIAHIGGIGSCSVGFANGGAAGFPMTDAARAIIKETAGA